MSPSETLDGPVQISSCQYQPGTGELFGPDGRRIHLRHQSAMVLSELVRQRDQTITKDALIAAVWGSLNVTDDSLVQCISEIRRAIGDRKKQVLQTIPKRGYRLAEDLTAGFRPRGGPARSDLGDIFACVHLRSSGELSFKDQFDEVQLIAADTGARRGVSADGLLLDFQSIQAAMSFVEKVSAALPTGAVRTGIAAQTSAPIGSDQDDPPSAAVASELSAIADPGDVLVSVAVRDALTDGLDCRLKDLGDLGLPGLGGYVRTYRVTPLDHSEDTVPLMHSGDLLPTLAVVPLRSRTGGEQAQIIGELLVDDVISALAQSSEIYVTSRLSTSRFRTRDTSLREIGSILRASFVLTGRYQIDARHIRVDAELSEVSSQRVLWAGTLSRTLEGTVDLVEELVTSVRRVIVLREVERANSSSALELENSSLLVAAIGLMHRFSPTDFQHARELLDILLERLPNAPVPLAWLARWHVLRVQQGWSEDPMQDAERALACTQRALDMDPGNVTALVAEGFVLTNLLSRLDDAEEKYDMALEFNPSEPIGSLLRGTLHAFRGDGQKATRDAERALHLAPLDPHRFFFLSLAASACIADEDYERALLLATQSLRTNRTHTSTLRVKSVALHRLGRGEEARETAEHLMTLQPGLTVGTWLDSSPSRDFPIGRAFAQTLLDIGVPK